ncbi:MAG: cation diffusion facilitator family transporter [Desulfovibrionaceae bacterium]
MSATATDARSQRPDATREVTFVTAVGLGCNLVLSAAKFAAGVLGHSQAMVADAVHSLSDMVTDLVIIVCARYWSKPADASHPYGHQRIETLVTLCIGAALASVAVGLSYDALVSLDGAPRPIPKGIACGAALVSIVVKEWLYRWTVAVGRRVHSRAVVANAHHHRSDALSSIPVAAATGIAAFVPGWSMLDPVGAVVVSIFILKTAWDVAGPALHELMDRGATPERIARITALAESVAGVRDVHAVRSRYQGEGLHLDMHVEVDPLISVHDGHLIAEMVKECLLDETDIEDVVVHIEPHGEMDGARA